MRKKPTLARGTLGLALAASLFLGCQDFLGGDNAKPAPAASDGNLEHAAQAIASQDSSKDSPPAACTALPSQAQPVQAAVDGSLEECKYLGSEMQAKGASEPYYMDIKYKFIAKNCAQVIGDANPTLPPPPPPPPADSANQCKSIADLLASLDPASTKYAYYKDLFATECAGTPSPVPAPVAEPAKPAPAPASGSLSPGQQVCLDLYNELQTAKDPRYGEVKNQYGILDCEAVLGDKKPVPVYTPPTLEERCGIYRKNLTETHPAGDPKWEAYLAEMAITCAAYP